jgi:hypothetical protein
VGKNRFQSLFVFHKWVNVCRLHAGDVAGAAIERMLEEMPVYRLWNWACRPEFFGGGPRRTLTPPDP